MERYIPLAGGPDILLPEPDADAAAAERDKQEERETQRRETQRKGERQRRQGRGNTQEEHAREGEKDHVKRALWRCTPAGGDSVTLQHGWVTMEKLFWNWHTGPLTCFHY